MEKLNFPDYQFQIKGDGEKSRIFDIIRRKYIVLTPEEWVRQNFIRFLIEEKQFPKSLIAVETGVKYNRMAQRSDIVVYDRSGLPVLITECKAPFIKIGQNAFDQAARYNMTLKVKYVVVTNGYNHYYCIIDHDKRKYFFIEDLPSFDEL